MCSVLVGERFPGKLNCRVRLEVAEMAQRESWYVVLACKVLDGVTSATVSVCLRSQSNQP